MFSSEQDCWNGAVLTTKNARHLYENAAAIHSMGNIGCASALMVLSAEESSKALAVGLHIARPVSDNYLESLFKRHVHKHEHAVYISSIIKQFLLTRKSEGENSLREFAILKFTQYWKSSADSIKKKGFYVDYVDGCWVSPDSITNKEYKTMQGQADVLLSFAEAFFLKGTLQELVS